jgi:DNA-binding response OmpR family regulator
MSARILVIEDDPDIRELIAISLRRAGFVVEPVENGERGLERAQARPPDLAIVDVMMPGISGHEVVQRLASDASTASIPIMMLSARGQARDVDDGFASGAHAYVVKPFSPRELVTRVSELLAHQPDMG